MEKEHIWLPRLTPYLPLPIPVPIAKGLPAEGYPWPWSVYRWLAGESAAVARIDDLGRFARELANFLAALQRVDATGGPPAGAHNFFRGGPLQVYDAETRQVVAALAEDIDRTAALAVWDAALATTWRAPPVWVHGDVAEGNLLVKDGRLIAVIDFGSSAVGDPACDLVIAWTFLTGESRDAFRSLLPFDEATWARGRGWALWKALITAARRANDNPAEATKARRVIDDIVADHARP